MEWYTCLVLCGFFALTNAILPDYIQVCKANDPELPQCIIKSIDVLKPKLVTGIPELGVPALEPLELGVVKLRKGIQANITDLKVWGPSNFNIIELRANVPKNRFAFIVTLPQLYFAGNYDMNTKILLVNLQGKGPITGNFTNYSFSAVLKGKRIQKEGEEYLKFDKMKLNIQFGKSTMKLENLFNGNPTLGRAANDVINDSQEAFLEEIKPAIESALAEKFTDIANKITLTFAFKELFL